MRLTRAAPVSFAVLIFLAMKVDAGIAVTQEVAVNIVETKKGRNLMVKHAGEV